MKTEKTKNYMMQYVIYTYGLFGLLLITLGGIAAVILHGTPLVMKWLISITPWYAVFYLIMAFRVGTFTIYRYFQCRKNL